MDGILIVDKPEGLTSADIVRRAKRALRVKVGHLGTLDPFATGVLPLSLGEGTKLAPFLSIADKVYTGDIRLGTEMDTGDRTGRVVRRAPVPVLQRHTLDVLSERLCGEQMQTPPMYSAVKQAGVPLYKLARAGREVPRAPRRIEVYRLCMQSTAGDIVAFELHCSKGTYVRVLAQDIALALGTTGHLESLRRTGFGAFTLNNAVTIEELEAGRVQTLIGMRDALRHLREIRIDSEVVGRVRRGHEAALRALPPSLPHETAMLVDPGGELVAVVSASAERSWQFARVFPPTRGQGEPLQGRAPMLSDTGE
jgi:tRNA pseudouridine55 synthase